jgi:hypothetical protein
MAGFNPSTDSKWKIWQPVEGLGTFETIMGGAFLPNTATKPLQVPVTGASTPNGGKAGAPDLWSVAHTATGRFTVTLAPGWGGGVGSGGGGAASTFKVKGVRVELQLNAAANLSVSASSFNNAAGTFEIDVTNPNTGALTDIAANANNIIHWHLRQSIGPTASIQNN